MPALELTGFEFARTWIPDLFEKLRTLRQARAKELDELADYFGDPLELAKCYVEPDCQQFNPADFDSEDVSVIREKLFKRFRSFISHKSHAGPSTLLVLSDAGMGKTSALVMLKLSHLFAFWPQGYSCTLLKLGPNSLEEIERISQKRSTVLLLDALDEDPTAWGHVAERLRCILAATTAFKRVIITCRTQFFSGGTDPFHLRGQVQISGFRVAVIYSSFLSDRQILEYLDRRSKEQSDSESWRQNALAVVERIGHLRMRPMLLAHIDDIVSSDTLVWNEYSLYDALVRAWLQREERKAFERSDNYPPQQVIFESCQLLAVEMHRRDRTTITHSEVERHTILYKHIKPVLGQHLGGRSLLNRTSEGDFRFSHFSIQEFLVSSYYLDGGQLYADQIRCTDQMNNFARAWLVHPKPRIIRRACLRVFNVDGLDLSQLNFDRANFQGLDLSRVALDGVTFHLCTLGSTRLGKKSISNVSFIDCDFDEADLEGAAITDSEFVGCTFRGVSFKSTRIQNSKVEACSFENVVCDISTKFPDDFSPAAHNIVIPLPPPKKSP